MRTEHIKYFLETCRLGSINKASENLCINHQHLGKILTDVENEIGIKLLNRNRVGVHLTNEGEKAVEIMRQIDLLYMQLLEVSSTKRMSTLKNLKCMSFAKMNNKNLANSMIQLQKRFSAISIEFLRAGNSEIIEAVSKDSTCVGNIFVSTMIKNLYTTLPENCIVYSTMDIEPVVLLHNKNPIFKKYKTISIKTILQYPMVIYTPYAIEDNHIYKMLRNFGNPNIKYQVDNVSSCMDILAESGAIGIAFKPISSQNGKELLFPKESEMVFIPIRERILAQTQWIINKDAIDNNIIKDYVDAAIEYEF